MNTSKLKQALLVLLIGTMGTALPAQSSKEVSWVASWGAAPDSAGPSLETQTLRQAVRVSRGGTRLRLRLSNLFGVGPVLIGPVHMALHAAASAIQPGSDHVVTFGGKPVVTIPKGGSVLSDPVKMEVAALQELVVSMYLPKGAGKSTIHTIGLASLYCGPGDATAATILPKTEPDDSRYFLTDVEVADGPEGRAFVAFGDSITDGVGSTADGNARWPDALATRLQGNPSLRAVGVVNSGISGNRILNDGVAPFLGPSALSRFDRDALQKPGTRWILVMQGINDIAGTEMHEASWEHVSAQQIIEGMKALISRAHAKGIAIWGATLLPCGGAPGKFHTEAGETKRQAVNAWIRAAGAFDAVIDFDQVLRDPADPDRLKPAFDSGDHLHPNNEGYQAMAASIDLRLFTQTGPAPVKAHPPQPRGSVSR